ncbi:uncharacterized protein [Rutidosis leptorrhynchoides]|uniref:uncharacterized protein isoform X2 n=1 Tax=Rutidosis leptorrhynchoides TaxID=125765 RepID=UPI003A9A3EF2
MPPELLPIDRKDILKERRPSSSEPVEIVPARWRESPTTPSSHPKNLWSPSGGPSDFRRPFTGPRVSVDFGNQKDRKGGNLWETIASPNGGQRLEKGNSLGSSLDWKPIKWIRSGSLSSRGGFSHSSSCKIIGADSLDTKIDSLQPCSTTVQSPSGDTEPRVTPRTPDEANSRKKARLGWGEGLAKYEKKKVDPNDVIDKEAGVDGVSSSEPLLPSPSNMPAKSPSIAGYSECASPTTSCSFACSSSPGVEENASVAEATVQTDPCNPSHVSENHTPELTFNLENLELPEGFNMNSLLDELLQTDETSAPGSTFAMDKLQVWKADISRTLEITESEIDSLENELKSLSSDVGGSCPILPASGFTLKKCNNKSIECNTAGDLESPGTSTSKLAEDNKYECSQDHVGTDMVTLCGDSSQASTVAAGDNVLDKLYDTILASNNATAKETSYEISKMLPTCFRTSISRVTDKSLMAEKIVMRKRFLKFKERVTCLKFRALHYYWKKDLCLLSVKKSGSKPQRKSELNFRLGFAEHQRHRASIHTRLSSPAGSLSLVPTKETFEYVSKLLSDSQVWNFRDVQKMPTFILDKGIRTSTRFISDNGLVEKPIDVEKEKSIVKAWTIEDKETFLNKYSHFGKNFRKIASFLPNKTVADCVEFYYKNHKSDDFQKAKRNSEFSKGKSHTTNTYLVTSGKQRLNREMRASSSLDLLGAASVMVSNVNGASSKNDFANICNEQETAAADVLAGICGSISPEALGSCITSLVDHGDVHQRVERCQKLTGSSSSLRYVDEETCSDDSCGEQMDSSHWTDEEKSSFMNAVRSYGKDFSMISRCVRTRSADQCRVYFSKAKNRFGLDVIGNQGCSEGTTGANQGDHDDACMVDSGSGISHDKSSSMECKMEVEDLHSSDKNVLEEGSIKLEPEGEDIKPDERSLDVHLEGAADSESNEAANVGPSPQTAYSDSASGAKVEEEADTVVKVCDKGIKESKHEVLCNGDNSAVRESSHGAVNNLSVTYYSRAGSLDLSIDGGSNLDLNAGSENGACHVAGNGFVTTSFFPKNLDRETVSQDDVSSRLSFRKGSQRSSSIDGYHLHLPKRENNFSLDESLLMPRDGCIQMCPDLPVSQEQRRCSSLDIEKPSRSGDVKLFGQILTNNSSLSKPDAEKSSNLKFENNGTHRKLGSLDLDQNKDFTFGVEQKLELNRSYGFWDGNRIQTGFSSLPDSAVLLAKYPSAFSNISTTLHSLESGNELQSKINNVASGFPSRKLSNNNRGPSYLPFTVDKLLPEIPKLEALSTSVQQGMGLKVAVSGACNGVSDPVAAIRMHYAKTEHYKNGSGESWRSNVSDIGSR